MYKNQLQELAQRSCFNLPAYTCIREGPDHAPRFKATVNFNGEVFESPNYCNTLRQAEHSAAEVALSSLSTRGPTHSLAARILDETGVYKNLLQEVSQRVGAPLPVYHSFRSGLGHLPVFTGTVELAGVTFTGEPAKNKKQAEKNAAMAAWTSLKQLAKEVANESIEDENPDELEHVTVAKALLVYRMKERIEAANSFRAPLLFPENLLVKPTQPSAVPKPPPAASSSKILPLFSPRAETQTPRYITMLQQSTTDGPAMPRAMSPRGERRRARRMAKAISSTNDSFVSGPLRQPLIPTMTPAAQSPESWRFPVMTAAPYGPFSQMRMPYQTVAPPVTMRSAVPVFSAPPLASHAIRPAANVRISSPVTYRPAIPSFPPPSVRIGLPPFLKKEETTSTLPKDSSPAPKFVANPTLKNEDVPKAETLTSPIQAENQQNEDSAKLKIEDDFDKLISSLPDEFLPVPHTEYSTPAATTPSEPSAISALERLVIK